MQEARSNVYNLVNSIGYSSCWETLPVYNSRTAREETSIKKRKNERKIEELLRKCEKQTTKYIKTHQKEVSEFGKLLYEKKYLKASEIGAV